MITEHVIIIGDHELIPELVLLYRMSLIVITEHALIFGCNLLITEYVLIYGCPL